VVPETATRLVEQQIHHIGRGGGKLLAWRCFVPLIDFDLGGNIYHAREEEHPSDPEGLANKLKHKVLGDKKDK
jgi:hypothetical protein